MEIALAVLLVLAFPIIAIAGLVIAIGARDRVRILEQRFADFQKSSARCRRRGAAIGSARGTDYRHPAAQQPEPTRPAAPARGRDPRGPRSYTETGGRRVGAALTATAFRYAGRAGDGLRGTLRHPMDRLGRRRRAGVRRFLPGPLFDRAGLVRPRHARVPRRPARARLDRRRRMGAPQGDPLGHRRRTGRAHPEHPHRRRHRRRLCRHLRRLRALQLHRARHRFHPARHRRAGNAGRRAGARSVRSPDSGSSAPM